MAKITINNVNWKEDVIIDVPLPTTAATANYTDDQLIKLLIGNDTDTAHITNAKKQIESWKATFLTASNTNTESPQKPTENVNISKPYWLGEWSGNVADAVKSAVSQSSGGTTLFVLYNIPGRDNGNYSAGGLKSPSEYTAWVSQVAGAIGTSKTIVVLEPDALGLSRSLDSAKKTERYNMLNGAIKMLKANANTKVFIDSSIWAGIDDSVNLLKLVTGMDGFSCNVSGYLDLNACNQYGQAVAAKTGLKYVVDTSRNGNGAPHGADIWCNQTDTKVGQGNTVSPVSNCYAYLWVKVPGESDGKKINGKDGDGKPEVAPAAGVMWNEFRDAIYSGDWKVFHAKYGN